MYELLIIWDDGKREVYNYKTYEEAEKAGEGCKMAFGNQISWYGVKEVNYIVENARRA